jgi:hypothetical protein
MSSQKNENIKEIKNIKEESIKIADQQQQKQEIEDTPKFTISDTTKNNTTSNNINDEYQNTTNKAIVDKNIDTAYNYNQEIINTVQSFSNDYNQLQRNIFNAYQSSFSNFKEAFNKYYWNSFMLPEKYLSAYIKINQNCIDNTINNTRAINEYILEYIETINRSVELAQKYYRNNFYNYFNFGSK